MELPKNITQIGEADKSCKIYVEDYVMSYLKQMNRFAEDKEMAVALYGRRSVERGVAYIFVYGACKLNFLQREVRHLSQAHNQEIERLRQKYFRECEFVGYTLLNGEMIEGIHIYEQGSCRYIKGYACFYEKNDGMLSYMLDNREQEAQPEVVNQEKYEQVKLRQEERRNELPENIEVEESPRKQRRTSQEIEARMHGMRFAAASMFVMLCLVCVVTLQTEGLGQEVAHKAKNLLGGIRRDGVNTEQEVPVMSDDVIGTLVAEEQLTEAIRRENQGNREGQVVAVQNDNVLNATPVPELTPQPTPLLTPEPSPQPTPEPTPIPTPIPTIVPTPEPTPIPAQSETVRNVYIIRTGDTLIGISTSLYGSEAYVKDICELNGISNPDNIQIGQKILLP